MRFTASTAAVLMSLALTVSAAPTKLTTSLESPPPEVPKIVGGALGLAGGITSTAGADKVGDALSGAGDSVEEGGAEKKSHLVRTLKGGDRDDKDAKKAAAGAAAGAALELAGSIVQGAAAAKKGGKDCDGKACEGKGCCTGKGCYDAAH